MTSAKKATIAITMGDLNGIGPEIIVKALSDESIRSMADFVIFGTQAHLCNAAQMLGIQKYWTAIPCGSIDFKAIKGVVAVDYPQYQLKQDCRRPDVDSGRASLLFCNDAIDAALAGDVDAIVTAPINKVSWKLAGGTWPGHTELLAEKCGTDVKAMMFVAGKMRLALATIHEGLFDIRHNFTIETVLQPIVLLNAALSDYFGIKNPAIGVAALNPHAGEQGRFGDEEIRVIKPAVDKAQALGINATGPYPADTLFLKAANGTYDGVVAMYHDQGMIPIKLMAFADAVNVTIGLPILRTSPAHGTAFDIAGKAIADASSMKQAIKVAVDMAGARRNK